jgi:hypothetical protein
MMETIEMLRKRIVDARAVGDSDFEQTALAMFLTFGQRLWHALSKYADKIVEASCCNNAQRLRELHDGLCALHACLEQWRLIAEELGVFSQASANGSDSGGGGCSPCAPAASFTSEEGSDA